MLQPRYAALGSSGTRPVHRAGPHERCPAGGARRWHPAAPSRLTSHTRSQTCEPPMPSRLSKVCRAVRRPLTVFGTGQPHRSATTCISEALGEKVQFEFSRVRPSSIPSNTFGPRQCGDLANYILTTLTASAGGRVLPFAPHAQSQMLSNFFLPCRALPGSLDVAFQMRRSIERTSSQYYRGATIRVVSGQKHLSPFLIVIGFSCGLRCPVLVIRNRPGYSDSLAPKIVTSSVAFSASNTRQAVSEVRTPDSALDKGAADAHKRRLGSTLSCFLGRLMPG